MNNRIEIKKISEALFRIYKDDKFNFVIVLSYGLYIQYLKVADITITKDLYDTNLALINTLERIMTAHDSFVLNDAEIALLGKWIGGICQITLEADGVDFGNKYVLKYFRLAQYLVKDIKKYTSYLEAIE